jgi:hypothetical protein
VKGLERFGTALMTRVCTMNVLGTGIHEIEEGLNFLSLAKHESVYPSNLVQDQSHLQLVANRDESWRGAQVGKVMKDTPSHTGPVVRQVWVRKTLVAQFCCL